MFVTAVVLLMVMALTVPTFANTTPATTARTNQEDTLKIGVLADHSGLLQLYGFEQSQGFELGLEYATNGTMEVAGRPIEVIIRDNASDIDTSN
ncbi:MAG: ABC transporter substrate-binding protein, partial [Chloroflexi bacterium]|nr:ABC transporter substrate-binding protein [Chloroflexota bacterium]